MSQRTGESNTGDMETKIFHNKKTAFDPKMFTRSESAASIDLLKLRQGHTEKVRANLNKSAVDESTDLIAEKSFSQQLVQRIKSRQNHLGKNHKTANDKNQIM